VRIAVLSDIHGNLEALDAVLEHVSKQKVDEVVVVGDIVVGAPDSVACWELVRSLGAHVLRGNHEAYVARYGLPEAPPAWVTEQYGPVRWTVERFSDHARRALGALPLSVHLEGAPDLLFVHASLHSDRDNLDAYTEEGELDAMFPSVRAAYIVRGHDHLAATRTWRGRHIVTNGSVGIPLNASTRAQYLVLERRRRDWQVTFHAVPYDVEATLRRFHETGYFEEAGPIARLFYREIATATFQLVPFLRGYERWSEGGKLSLEGAVRRFLTFGAP